MTDAEVRKPVPAWIWGGALLAASAVVPTGVRAVAPGGLGSGVAIVAIVLFAASLVVFAFGLRGRGSIVARRPSGVAALLVLAILPPLVELAIPALSNEQDIPRLQILSAVHLAVTAAAALVAVVAIGRAAVIPRPWHWAPAWGFAAMAVTFALPQIAAVSASGTGLDDLTGLFVLGSLVALAMPLALGILAMVLGARGLTVASAQIYPPAA